MSGYADPGGVRDEERLAPDAPGQDINMTPAGMELTFQTPTTEGAVYEEPQRGYQRTYQKAKRTSFKAPPPESRGQRAAAFNPGASRQDEQPKQFREQFDHLMKRLEDRFQNERLNLEEKHSHELEEAMGYFSLSSNEREAKQQELQAALLEDIGDMAQQLHELTGALGTEGDAESLTLPSDPRVLEEYARKMQNLEDQFQQEKAGLEQKQAHEMEQALGTLKMSREQREVKQLELQDQISAEIGDMARQLEELNQAKQAYESKMGMIKQQLSKEEPIGSRAPDDPKLQSMNRRLSDVERERDTAQEELRRLKLALQVTHGEGGSLIADQARSQPQRTTPQQKNPTTQGRLSPQEQNNISSLRGRIEQIERELKQAAQTPGGSETMKGLRERMKMIESDLEAAEESTKEHFALEHLRARMEKVERLLTEGERAATEWEALEQLRSKIGNVDNDLKAVEEAKKEFEALEALRSKMEAVESELKVAEQLATDRENVDSLRKRLGQVERELGVAEPSQEDPSSIDKLLARLAKAESSLQDAREVTRASKRPPAMPASDSRGIQMPGSGDDEVENILERLALAEKKLSEAKESAQRRNPNTSSGYPNLPAQALQSPAPQIPPPTTPLDARQAKIRARLQEHFDESDPAVKNSDEKEQEQPKPLPKQEDARVVPPSNRQTMERGPRSKFEEPRSVGGRNRYYVQDVQLDREVPSRAATFEDETIPTQEPVHLDDLEENYESDVYGATPRPLRRRRPGEEPEPIRKQYIVDELAGPATRPLRRRYAGEAAEGVTKPSRPETESKHSSSTPCTVLGVDEDRYAADLEELRYQRALLSQKLPRNRHDDEEKKSEDTAEAEPKYSFKQAIRNEERQRLREKMNPRLAPNKPTRELKVPSDPRWLVSPTNEAANEPATSELEQVAVEPETRGAEAAVDESQSKAGGDPPIKPSPEATGDPPSQTPSLEKELQSRLLSQTVAPGRDPHPGNGGFRTSRDPPAHVDPPQPPSLPSTPFVAIAEKEHPSDEKSDKANSVRDRGTVNEEVRSMVSDLRSSFRPDASVSSNRTPATAAPKPETRRSNQWCSGSNAEASRVSEASAPSSSAPSISLSPPTPRSDPSPVQQQLFRQGPQESPDQPPPPRPPQVPQPPPSPGYEQSSPRMPQSLQPLSDLDESQEYSLALRDESQPPPSPPPPLAAVHQSVQSPPPPPAPQQPLFHQTTVVDGKAAARERREKDRLMRWVVLILLCIAIILAVVIIVVIVLLRDGDDSPQNVPSATVPTLTPAPVPTIAPTIENMTIVPTMQPTLEGSGGGSWPPTVFSGCPELESNVPLQTNGETIDGNTVGAFYDATVLGPCGNIDQAGDNGVWYALIGEGEVVTVSTCTLFFPSFDTQLLIYTPTNQTSGCRSGLDCVASNDNFCGLQSSVTFIAQADTLYLIYVNGMTDTPAEGFNATEGEFSLTVSTSPEGSCQGALDLEVAPADLLPVIVVGSLIGGTFGVDPCNPEVESRTGELWYKVVGTGKVVVASTCHSVSNFAARLAVYTGFCDNLMCITSEDDDCGNGSEISWFAQPGVEYFLLVYSPIFVPDVEFGITIQERF